MHFVYEQALGPTSLSSYLPINFFMQNVPATVWNLVCSHVLQVLMGMIARVVFPGTTGGVPVHARQLTIGVMRRCMYAHL